MKVGIVGLPNVGKSTLFQALTKKTALAANYPFCTIDPNVGIVEVPDERLEKLSKVSDSEKTIYTAIEFVDIAGLVKGAHKGEGLGNQFLSHIREVDAIIEVLRDFEDENIVHVEGNVDPKRDQETIRLELVMADLQTVEKKIERLKKEVKSGDKKIITELSFFEDLKSHLDAGNPARNFEMSGSQFEYIEPLSLLTQKPIIFIKNIDQEERQKNPTQNSKENKDFLEIDAKLESELSSLSPEEIKEYLSEIGIKQTGLDKLIVKSYQALNLITFLTSGKQESRAWTVRCGALAPQAAGRIHTDFEKGFIRAEVASFTDFIKYGGWNGVKEKGLMRLEGKDYQICDGDVVFFRIAS